ncbi:MAG: gliding motility lipoprotein GldH [Sphingobacteriaceae bacterium]|nr:MAG: gliding motility lipoprotein GldH [Sphingobacteriaceae bacterium]
MRVKLLLAALFISLISTFSACNESGTLADQRTEISSQTWFYFNKIKTEVKVEDTSVPYNVYFILRHAAEYKYANIFILMHQTTPDHHTKTIRYEFKLANPDGEWLGNGSGNLYNYVLPLYTNFRFPIKGNYTFTLEQNMRDNPLRGISDVGLRVERAK